MRCPRMMSPLIKLSSVRILQNNIINLLEADRIPYTAFTTMLNVTLDIILQGATYIRHQYSQKERPQKGSSVQRSTGTLKKP